MKFYILLAGISMLLVLPAQAKDSDDGLPEEPIAKVEMHEVSKSGIGESIGHVAVHTSDHGLIFKPTLESLSPGMHGFHLHAKGSCEPAKKDGKTTPAGAAGGHYDPEETGAHGTPWGDGHLGDLPALYVDQDGTAVQPVLSPRLEEDDLKGKALMIHAKGDNYSDKPKPSGGGGARIACGVFGK